MNKAKTWISDLEDKPKDITQNMIQKSEKYKTCEEKWDRRWRKSYHHPMEAPQGKKTEKGGKRQRNNKEKIPEVEKWTISEWRDPENAKPEPCNKIQN